MPSASSKASALAYGERGRGAGSPGTKGPLLAQVVQLAAVDTPLVEVVGPVPGQ